MSGSAVPQASAGIDPPGRRSSWFLVLALTSVGLATLACFLLYRFYIPVQLPVETADRNLLLTAQDFSDYDQNLIVRIDAEDLSKQRMPDGSVILEYRYADSVAPLYIHCQIVSAKDRGSAREMFASRAQQTVVCISDNSVNAVWKAGSQPFSWGDQWEFGPLKDGQQTIGSVFLCRIGSQLFFLQVEGVLIENYGQLYPLVSRQLTNLEARDVQPSATHFGW